MSNRPVLQKMIEKGRAGHPVSALFEVTHRCNARCAYCYVRHGPTTPDLDTAEVKTLIDRLASEDILFLNLSGGEPFLREDIIDILEHAMSRNFLGLGIMTNGILIGEKELAFLIQHRDRIPNISLSLFSHIPAINDGYFGVTGATDRIMHVATTLRQADVGVLVKVSVLDFNLDTFADTISYLQERDLPAAHFAPKLCTDGHECHGCDLSRYADKEFFLEYLTKAPPSFQDAVKTDLRQWQHGSAVRDFCQGRHSGICIDPRGGIRPCVAFRTTGDVNLLHDARPLADIIHDSPLLRACRSARREDIARCRHCEHFRYCSVCLARSYNEHGHFNLPPTDTCSYTAAVREFADER